MLSIIATVLAAAASVQAHFQLITPSPRVYNDILELNPPCGGSNSTAVRYPFPIKGGSVTFKAFHSNAVMTFNVAFVNPQVQSDFVAKYLPDLTLSAIGSYTLTPDFSTIPQAQLGTNATLQLTFNGGDGFLYQCTDVTFTASAQTGGAGATAASLGLGSQVAAAGLLAGAALLL
eukprot:jgi/Hompol1/301/HPOL_001348-RA